MPAAASTAAVLVLSPGPELVQPDEEVLTGAHIYTVSDEDTSSSENWECPSPVLNDEVRVPPIMSLHVRVFLFGSFAAAPKWVMCLAQRRFGCCADIHQRSKVKTAGF